MTPSLFFSRLKAILEDIEISAGVKLFKDVKAVASYDANFLKRLRFPSALIVISGFMPDLEHPQIGEQSFSVIFATNNKTDVYGENVFIGSGVSTGLHDVERKVLEAISGLQTLSGSINIQESGIGGAKYATSKNITIMYREFKCNVWLEGF